MMFPSDLSGVYDQYGFNRGELFEFLAGFGVGASKETEHNNAIIRTETVPDWANSCRAIKRFTLAQAAKVLICSDPMDCGFLHDDGQREFLRAYTALGQATEDGDLQPVGEDESRHLLFRSQDLSAWAASVGLEWCIPSDVPAEAVIPAGAADETTRQRLRQLEAENARLSDQVAELQQQLQEATAAAQRAPQEAGPAPQEAAAAPQADDDKPSSRWPWGNHHTEALGHLEAAGLRFWQWFDPTDPTTAPTNDTVAGWLVSEHGEGKVRAQYIASLLRADGLPSGPRR